MRGVLYWIVEQACRPFDSMVCEIANVTDEPDWRSSGSGYGRRASA